MKYYHDDDFVLDTPLKDKKGKRARRTDNKKNRFDYDDAWCSMDDIDIELSSISRKLQKEFDDIKETERLTLLGLFHVMDIPFHIVEIIYKKI